MKVVGLKAEEDDKKAEMMSLLDHNEDSMRLGVDLKAELDALQLHAKTIES